MESARAGWKFCSTDNGPFDPEWIPARWDGNEWVSDPVPVAPCTGLILSWNVELPNWSGCSFKVSVRRDGVWSAWTPMGEWGNVFPTRQPDGPIARDVDRAVWDGAADMLRVKARMFPNHDGEQPRLMRVVVACDVATDGAGDAVSRPPHPERMVQDAPFRSQMTEADDIARRLCGPTSLAMHLSVDYPDTRTSAVATLSFDAVHNVYGNWPHLAAVAGGRGYVAWVERNQWLSDVEARLLSGYGAILSLAYGEGELSGSPVPSTSGHLLVLRGWDDGGDPVCNDPAFSDSRGDGVVYPRAEFERAWREHGGVTILLRRT